MKKIIKNACILPMLLAQSLTKKLNYVPEFEIDIGLKTKIKANHLSCFFMTLINYLGGCNPMAKQIVKTPLALAVSAALSIGGMTIASNVNADSNPFGATDLTGGYMNDSHGKEAAEGVKEAAKEAAEKGKEAAKEAAEKGKEGKCGEGKCGGDMEKSDSDDDKGKEGKCGEGKCGGAK